MKHILHIINGEFYSGAERVQDLLALKLPEFGYDVFFACIKEGVFKTNCQSDPGRAFDFPMRNKLDLSCAMAIAKFAKKHDCSLIHTHTPRSALVGRLAMTFSGLPMVHHAHSPTASCTENSIRNLVNPFFEHLAIRKSKKIIAVSENIASLLTKHIQSHLITYVPNGVPTPGVLEDRPLPSLPWTIGIAALFRPRKGLEMLLEALAMLKKHCREFRLRAVGDFETEEYKTEILTLTDHLGLHNNIDWLGFKQDINQELRQMDIFVLPSLFGEGTPMVILEAMAIGCPVIATAVKGVPEVIRDGVEGVLASPGDKMSLFQALKKITDGQADWSALRVKAYERQRTYYSDRRMAADVAAIYDEILKPS